MNAILQTLCGCEKFLQVPYPPPQFWRVPYSGPRAYVVTDEFEDLPRSTNIEVRIREFALWDVTPEYAVYRERFQP